MKLNKKNGLAALVVLALAGTGCANQRSAVKGAVMGKENKRAEYTKVEDNIKRVTIEELTNNYEKYEKDIVWVEGRMGICDGVKDVKENVKERVVKWHFALTSTSEFDPTKPYVRAFIDGENTEQLHDIHIKTCNHEATGCGKNIVGVVGKFYRGQHGPYENTWMIDPMFIVYKDPVFGKQEIVNVDYGDKFSEKEKHSIWATIIRYGFKAAF